jgi:hypothetical protein
MTDFIETMRLAEKAQEDIYFAKLNRKLIENLHRLAAAEKAAAAGASAVAEATDRSARTRQG